MTDFVDCSPLPAFYRTHLGALQDLQNAFLPEGKSAVLPLEFNGHKLSLALLRELAAKLTVGTCVVLDHGTCFEVCNLGKGASASSFYAHCKMNEQTETPEEKSATDQICELLRKRIQTYNFATLEDSKRYDDNISKELLEYKYVTYAYLQRTCASNAALRKNGGTEALKQALDAMLEKGELLKISQAVTEKLFNISGKVYDYSALIAK